MTVDTLNKCIERRIRTHVRTFVLAVLETAAFNHSAISIFICLCTSGGRRTHTPHHCRASGFKPDMYYQFHHRGVALLGVEPRKSFGFEPNAFTNAFTI